MVHQVPSFGSHLCSCADKHYLWCDSQKMFQAHTDFKWAYPLPRTHKLFTFVLEVNKCLLNFSVAWNRLGRVALVSKPGSNGLKWSVCTTPSLNETKWTLIFTSQTFSDSCLFYHSSFGNEAVVLNGETPSYGHPVNIHGLLFHFILIPPNTHSATSYLKNLYNIDRFLWPISDQIVRFHCHFRGKVIENFFFWQQSFASNWF